MGRVAPFRKVLIANRGEIAVRVMQTCTELGIRTVAVYSDADKDSLHVARADEAIHIGAAAASQSYLNSERIIAAATSSGAEAIHPGYGFLSETPHFAEACRVAGLTFIGPTPEAMQLLGSKRAAKHLARRAGVLVVPGYDGDDQSLETLTREAARIGFPLLIKASAGGGGKGMRTVASADELAKTLDRAKREAQAAFGDDSVLLEKLIERARHVEIQLLADSHGNVVHLGERDCSTQRRHQKVIEESPSPAVTDELRVRTGEAAVALAKAAGYVNAGTVEFIVSPDRSFYFLEVNTRLQVEHPVTELVAGLDLVREQILIASGEPLSVRQGDVRLRGHAIECRLYAEDPAKGFLPSTGTLTRYAPPHGVGIRNDTGVRVGSEVTPYYDPMLAKLIVHAGTRELAIERARYALSRYVVEGVTTNLPLLAAILDSETFRAGGVTTRFLDEQIVELLTNAPVPRAGADAEAEAAPRAEGFNPWRGVAAPVIRGSKGRSPSSTRRVETGLTARGLGSGARAASRAPAREARRVVAPLTGTVTKVAVGSGDRVESGDVVVVLEAMKMEIAVEAPRTGTVTDIKCAPGDLVQSGQVLAEIGD